MELLLSGLRKSKLCLLFVGEEIGFFMIVKLHAQEFWMDQ